MSSSKTVAVVITTVGTEEQALDIANHLVGERLAACVNILPRIRSIFRWKGKVNDDSEFLLLVKTVESNIPAVKEAIKKLHTYEVPEILGFPAAFADDAFGEWVASATKPPRKKKQK